MLRQPQIFELCRFLKAMEADIPEKARRRSVSGEQKELHDVEYAIIPDRIVAVYLLISAGGSHKGAGAPAESPS